MTRPLQHALAPARGKLVFGGYGAAIVALARTLGAASRDETRTVRYGPMSPRSPGVDEAPLSSRR